MKIKNFISSLMVASALSSFTASAEQINKIIVEGNTRVETSTIESYLKIKLGDQLDQHKQEESIKALFDTALFDNVKISNRGNTLLVHVVETPLVIKVVLRGNSKISAKKINNEVLTKSGSSLRLSDIEHDKAKIAEMYKKSGRFAVRVSEEIQKLPNNRVKVIYNIVEGPKTSVRNINFIGNNHYSNSELRSVILTKESAWFRFLESNDTYDPDRMEVDKQFLTDFYQSVGFADFKILSSKAELSTTKDYFILTYVFDEGQKYKFGTIDIQNNIDEIDINKIKHKIKAKSGKLYSKNKLEASEEDIAEWLSEHGYPNVHIHHDIDKDPTTNIANVKFIIDKADKVFINRINITGNLKTHEKVIRREFKSAEGDLLQSSQIKKGYRNIRRLDYFEKADLSLKDTDKPSRYDVNLDVQEKSTASMGLELGYNTSSGPFTRLSYADHNVLGTGKDFHAGVQLGKRSTTYSVGLTEPYFLDKNLSLGANFFYSQIGSSGAHNSGFWGESSSYKMNSKGAKFTLGYNLIDDLSHSIFYGIKYDELSLQGNQKSIAIQEQMGKYTTSEIGHTVALDKTDNIYMPKSGVYVEGTQQYAGVGGQNKYLKHDMTVSFYSSYFENKYTLKLSGSLGDIRAPKHHTVRINDRFNLGDATLRGFAPSGIGPRDKRTGEPLGGKKYYSATAELQFPIGMPQEFNLSGLVFTDMGGVYDFDIKNTSLYTKKDIYNSTAPRVSYGIGLIWNTRIVPIRIDYAFRLRKQHYDEVQPWHFRFSTNF